MKKFYIFVISLFMVNYTMAQWIALSSYTSESLKSVYFTDANNGFVGGNNAFLKTTNGGSTWSVIPIGGLFVFHSIDFPSADTGYAVGFSFDGNIYKTTDAGTTWAPYTGSIQGELSTVYFTDNNTGYTAGNWTNTGTGDWCNIYKTTDGGTNWNIIAGPLHNYHLYSSFFTDSNTGYEVGQQSYVGQFIMKTNNGGTTWDTIQIGGTGFRLVSVFFTNVDTGYVVGLGGTILKTTNGGTTWTEMWSGKDWNFTSVFFASTDTGYIVGHDYPDTNNIILKTVNGGNTWTEQPSGTNVILESVYFTSVDTGYIVGWDGTILKTTNGGGTSVGVNEKLSTSNSLKIYPNPSSNVITIETSTKGHLFIQNVNGQELLNQPISKPSAQIDIKNLPAGVYFMRLTNEKTVRVGKFIKQ